MKWEYMYVKQDGNYREKSWKTFANKCYQLGSNMSTLIELLDELGKQGWELVSSTSTTQYDTEYVLKRPITK